MTIALGMYLREQCYRWCVLEILHPVMRVGTCALVRHSSRHPHKEAGAAKGPHCADVTRSRLDSPRKTGNMLQVVVPCRRICPDIPQVAATKIVRANKNRRGGPIFSELLTNELGH